MPPCDAVAAEGLRERVAKRSVAPRSSRHFAAMWNLVAIRGIADIDQAAPIKRATFALCIRPSENLTRSPHGQRLEFFLLRRPPSDVNAPVRARIARADPSRNFFAPLVNWITFARKEPGQDAAYRAAQADFNVRGWQGRWRYTASAALFFLRVALSRNFPLCRGSERNPRRRAICVPCGLVAECASHKPEDQS
jgi:hypothetical protein